MTTLKPYYETEFGKIYHGDCMEIMADIGVVDLVITDPPYGMNYQSNRRKVKYDKIRNDEFIPIDAIHSAINKAKRASYIFCRWDFLCQLPIPKSLLVWVKNNHTAGDLKHEHGRKWEGICFYPKEEHEFKKRIPDVIHCKRTQNNLHPTEKPVGLFHEIVQANVCDSVLDPFMGSGTTSIACERLGKRWVGIEIEEIYCEVAANRIEKENKQLSLFKF